MIIYFSKLELNYFVRTDYTIANYLPEKIILDEI